jgi:branched-chain amino acid transport system ATP-binding protein
LLQGRGLTKRFGGLTAVNGVDIDVNEGEIVGLIGPNGSGKTTLFNLVAGFHPADAGSLRFRGEDIAGLPPDQVCHRGIGRTFQLSRPFSGMDVAHNLVVAVLYGNAGMRHVGQARAEARRLLDYLGLGEVAAAPVSRLTLAQRKRLEIGRALATHPRLLLLDEAMAGLGAAEVRWAIDLLRRLRQDMGLTLVIVEHVMQVIMGICDRVVVLSSGVRIADGRPEEVARDPKVVQAYLGRGRVTSEK